MIFLYDKKNCLPKRMGQNVIAFFLYVDFSFFFLMLPDTENTMGNMQQIRVNKIPAFWLEYRKEVAQRIIKYEEKKREGFHKSDSITLFINCQPYSQAEHAWV